MKAAVAILLLLLAGVCGARAQDILDQLDQALNYSAFSGAFRVRLSGTVDFEEYHLDQPAPGLIYTNKHNLFNPRVTMYMDAQVGPYLYAFAQSRIDRGFDPSDSGARMRLDEYALRYTPWTDGRFNVQIGKFSTVVGSWATRHGSWDNPFITAPLPYTNLTGLWDDLAPANAAQLAAWGHANAKDTASEVYADKKERAPIIWGPSYASGAAIFGGIDKFNYAAEVKNSSLSSHPDSWDFTQQGFSNPTFSGRLGWDPNAMWKLGVSGSVGPYLLPEATSSLPASHGVGDYNEILIGQDVSFAWHHFQLWAEVFETRFQVPNVGNADVLAYYVEAKYKFTPQFFGALRWNQQLYGNVRDGDQMVPWGSNAWQIDAAIGYRFTEYTQLKLQYSILEQDPAQDRYNNMFAAQFTLKF